MRKLFAILIGLFLLAANIELASAVSDPWEEWAAKHTYNVMVIEKLKYENGQLVQETVYISPELKKKFGSEMLYEFTKLKIDRKALIKALGVEGLKLMLGMEVTMKSYQTTAVIVDPNDPYPWWDYYPYLPRWTWKPVYSPSGWLEGYKRSGPINLVWEGGTKEEVKDVLDSNGWWDFVYAYNQYIYDPPEYGGGGWEEGDDMATHPTGTPERNHVILWMIYNGKVVGSAHHDEGFPHVGVDWEEVEELIASYYYSPWVVYPDWYYLDNRVADQYGYNDGYATRIKKW